MASTHIIRRQFVDVEFDGSESDALALQNRLLALCQQDLGPALERVFDRIAPAAEHWTIDRLDIDAGSFSRVNLEQLIAAVAESVERQMREIAPSTLFQAAATTTWDSLPSRHSDQNATPGGSVQLRSETQSLQEAFLYFLETGLLPWWFYLPPGKSLESVLLGAWQQDSREFRPLDLARVLHHRLGSPSVRKRLVRQFSHDFLSALLLALSSQTDATLHGVIAALRTGESSEPVPLLFIDALWEAAFLVAASSATATQEQLVSTALRLTPPDADAQHSKFFELINNLWPASPAGTTIDDSIAASLHAGEPKLSEGTASKSFPLDLEDGLFTRCAGIILLHPFLPRFFEGLGIVANDTLLDPDRALCLLHYLATGQQFAPEYDLLVPKVLCNLPLDMPVSSHIELTPAEEEEAFALLQAVISHWAALGDSSAEGLRGSFLVRPGKLSQRDGEYLLHVEPQSYDILLDLLPWGLGLIKLPWMQKSLWVEWRF